jgi:mannose/fructose/N-acetylgalactosamine-specific phosphotransferase system component IID
VAAMSIKQIINIIGLSVIAALIITVIVLSCIVSSQSKEIAIIKNDRNYLSQTIDKLKSESIKQQEILDEREELLQEVKQARTLKEYLIVWEKVNRSLK